MNTSKEFNFYALLMSATPVISLAFGLAGDLWILKSAAVAYAYFATFIHTLMFLGQRSWMKSMLSQNYLPPVPIWMLKALDVSLLALLIIAGHPYLGFAFAVGCALSWTAQGRYLLLREKVSAKVDSADIKKE